MRTSVSLKASFVFLVKLLISHIATNVVDQVKKVAEETILKVSYHVLCCAVEVVNLK